MRNHPQSAPSSIAIPSTAKYLSNILIYNNFNHMLRLSTGTTAISI